MEAIASARERLGADLLLLAHFYQHDDIVRYADFVGDSLQLAQQAAQNRDARYIVFCSVSFMAETARILCRPDQEVLHPEPKATCPLADMANIEQVEKAWKTIGSLGKEIVPVVYVNSNADLKAFCAKHHGTVCTSANVKSIFSKILSEGKSLFFFPDENMGRNIAGDMKISPDDILLWTREGQLNGAKAHDPADAKVYLWEGFCIVHRVMDNQDIERIRQTYEGIRLIVHPECTPEVYSASDFAGSTNFIKKTIEGSATGSKWAIGTEFNFVNRIRTENPDKLIIPLSDERCRNMAKVTPEKLLAVLDGLVHGELVNRVSVDPEITRLAKKALDTMLEMG
jgi:quinolinate synthase